MKIPIFLLHIAHQLENKILFSIGLALLQLEYSLYYFVDNRLLMLGGVNQRI